MGNASRSSRRVGCLTIATVNNPCQPPFAVCMRPVPPNRKLLSKQVFRFPNNRRTLCPRLCADLNDGTPWKKHPDDARARRLLCCSPRLRYVFHRGRVLDKQCWTLVLSLAMPLTCVMPGGGRGGSAGYHACDLPGVFKMVASRPRAFELQCYIPFEGFRAQPERVGHRWPSSKAQKQDFESAVQACLTHYAWLASASVDRGVYGTTPSTNIITWHTLQRWAVP